MNTSKFKNTKTATLAVIASTLLLIAGCERDPDGITHIIYPETFSVGPEGGYIYAMDNNVQFWIPENAVSEEVVFTIRSITKDEDADFYIHSIWLMPESVEFSKPVGLSMKYNGCLKNGKDPCKAECLALYRFDNDMLYDTRRPEDLVWIEQCCLNRAECCIETLIPGGGIYAVGEASMDKTEH